MLNQRSDKLELIRIAEAVAVEKSIDKEIILTAMESAIQKAAKTRFGTENDIRAIITEKKDNLNIGEEIFEQLPPVDFGRIAAQTARQVITQSVRAAERERQYNDFIDKKGEILSGMVKRLEYNNVIVDLNRAEALIKKEDLIPREVLKTGDRIKAYCYDVIRENKGQQIFLSRAHPKLMEKLFAQEVPEIYD